MESAHHHPKRSGKIIMFKDIETFRQKSTRLRGFIDFWGCLYLAAWNWIFSYIPSYAIRRLILKYAYGVKMGRDVYVHMGVKFLKPWAVEIGNNVNIQLGSFIDGRGGLSIGNNVDITLGVRILTQQHDLQDSHYTTVSRSVCILDNCVVGSFALIMPGVTLGEGAVVGAGSVVSKSIPEWSIAVGNPCTVRKQRNRTINYEIGYARPFH
jgi:putative colanic acid biosynthesis acetyltransferase WcaF